MIWAAWSSDEVGMASVWLLSNNFLDSSFTQAESLRYLSSW